MRTALLVMTEPAGNGQPLPKAFLRLGGKTLARHQLGAAIALGCERVIGIARAMEPEILALQHAAEDAGLGFHLVSGPRDLARYVSAADDLVLFAEGLLAEPQALASALKGAGPAVLVQPVETGVRAGFERLDLNHASAGAALVPGGLVDKLFELPPDCDIVSSLTRLALQNGIPRREVAGIAQSGTGWVMIGTEMDAYAIEADWLNAQMPRSDSGSPGLALSRLAVTGFGSSLLDGAGGSRALALGSWVLAAIALLAGWLGLPFAGFLICAIAWVVLRSAMMLERIEVAGTGMDQGKDVYFTAIGWGIDAVFVALALWSGPRLPWDRLGEHLFAPVVLVLTARLVPTVLGGRWVEWIADRMLLFGAMAVFALLGVVPEAVRTGAAALLIVALAVASLSSRITRP